METLTTKQKVGLKIKMLRRSYGHSQEVLAEKINISKDRISKTERGITFISEDMLDCLCKFYKVKESYFFNFTTPLDNLDRDKLVDSINSELKELSIRKLKKVEEIIKIIK